jgi:hypothetical protein
MSVAPTQASNLDPGAFMDATLSVERSISPP